MKTRGLDVTLPEHTVDAGAASASRYAASSPATSC